MYNIQYVVGGVLSFSVSMYILVKSHKTTAMKSLLLFGLVISLWEASVYLSRTAPDMATATKFFFINILTAHMSYPLLLFTFLTVQEGRSTKSLAVFIPALIQMAVMSQGYFENYELFPTEVGWSYRVIHYDPKIIIVSVIFLGYLLGTFIVLLRLTRKTKLLLFRRKYNILLIGFTVFQAGGITLTNALIAIGILDPMFRMGGILQFLMFLSIWYALAIKEREIPRPILKGGKISEIYSSFLTIYYNHAINTHLGEEVAEFQEFLSRSDIENKVTITSDKIIFNEEDLDLEELIDRNIEFFDEKKVDEEIVDNYLRVLNAAAQKLGWRFDRLVKENEFFLLKSDLLYGVSSGSFIEGVDKDESLRGLEDAEACLKIYKRILLSIMDTIQMKIEFKDILSEHLLANVLKVTEYGEVSLKEVKVQVHKIPEAQRVAAITKDFNSVISQVFEELLSSYSGDITGELRKLKLVLALNKDRANDLGVYPTLLGTLATKIPRTQIHRLYSEYLEDLVHERTKKLEEAQEKLLKAQRLASIGEVAAMVGHDLRNPLQVIMYALYLAEKRFKPSDCEGLEEVFATIREQVKYMDKIVSDLQDYARPLKPKSIETSLPELINKTISTITIPGNVKISTLIDEDLMTTKLFVDPLMIQRVFVNLVTNALQAMHEGGELKIKASIEDGSVLIRFQDTGVGISKERLPKIFQPLFTTKAKGQGLGLAVCKRLIEAHGGKIEVDSIEGAGSKFTVILPISSRYN